MPLTEQDAEPPSSETVDRVMAISHLDSPAHVAVIGHRTLPFVLALLGRGCRAVRSLRPDAPSPDCEPAELSWIVDLQDERELDGALRAARWRAGKRGRVVLEGASCRWRSALAAVREHALAAGLDIVSFDHVSRRVVLAPTTRLAKAA
jgi:hypothetical protein